MSEAKFTRLTESVGNVTDMIRLKRLGKIRLGVKKQNAQTGREYPSETPWFIVTPEVAAQYGENPTVISGAMFVSNDPEEIYREKLALYGKGTGLKCHGNGKLALERTEKGDWKERSCPCDRLKTADNPQGACKPKGDLMVMLPKVSMWGNYQITTHSTYARAGILSSLKQLRDMVGRIGFVPLRLERVPQKIVHDGHEKTHYIVGFTPELTIPQIIEMRTKPDLIMIESRAIEPPIDTNPEDDPVDEVVDGPEIDEHGQVDAEELAHADEAKMEEVRQRLAAQQPKTEPKPAEKKANGKPPVDVTTREALKPIDAGVWCDTINAIDEDPDLRDIKEKVKADMKLPSLKHEKLTAPGQHEFLKRFRVKATDAGYGDRLTNLFAQPA